MFREAQIKFRMISEGSCENYGSLFPPQSKKLKQVIVTFYLTILPFFLIIARYKYAIVSQVIILRYKLSILTFFLRITSLYLAIMTFFRAIMTFFPELWDINGEHISPFCPLKLEFNSQLRAYISQFWLYNSQLREEWKLKPFIFWQINRGLLLKLIHGRKSFKKS